MLVRRRARFGECSLEVGGLASSCEFNDLPAACDLVVEFVFYSGEDDCVSAEVGLRVVSCFDLCRFGVFEEHEFLGRETDDEDGDVVIEDFGLENFNVFKIEKAAMRDVAFGQVWIDGGHEQVERRFSTPLTQ